MHKWISVYDRLPDKDGRYLVAKSIGCFQHEVTVLRFHKDKPHDHWFNTRNRTWPHNVTHWMPLPEPPEAMNGHQDPIGRDGPVGCEKEADACEL